MAANDGQKTAPVLTDAKHTHLLWNDKSFNATSRWADNDKPNLFIRALARMGWTNLIRIPFTQKAVYSFLTDTQRKTRTENLDNMAPNWFQRILGFMGLRRLAMFRKAHKAHRSDTYLARSQSKSVSKILKATATANKAGVHNTDHSAESALQGKQENVVANTLIALAESTQNYSGINEAKDTPNAKALLEALAPKGSQLHKDLGSNLKAVKPAMDLALTLAAAKHKDADTAYTAIEAAYNNAKGRNVTTNMLLADVAMHYMQKAGVPAGQKATTGENAKEATYLAKFRADRVSEFKLEKGDNTEQANRNTRMMQHSFANSHRNGIFKGGFGKTQTVKDLGAEAQTLTSNVAANL